MADFRRLGVSRDGLVHAAQPQQGVPGMGEGLPFDRTFPDFLSYLDCLLAEFQRSLVILTVMHQKAEAG